MWRTGIEIFEPALLTVCAFLLGACPFSVWVGRWLLGKDIRAYGDGNPGAANVFRAGSRRAGTLAVLLDLAKGIPFVALAHSTGQPDAVALAVGLSAVLGHAFSPLLHFRGGKAVAVTFGVLIALPQHEMLAAFTAFTILGFLFIQNDAWTVLLGPVGTLAYLAVTRGNSWESAFMFFVLALFVLKYHNDLQTIPRARLKVIDWLQSIKRET